MMMVMMMMMITIDFPETSFNNMVSGNYVNYAALHIHVFILSELWEGKSFNPGVYVYRYASRRSHLVMTHCFTINFFYVVIK